MRRTCFLLLMCLFAIAPREAGAALIPASGLTYEVGSDLRWEYDLGLEPDQEIRALAQFTIYDFAGFIPGSDKASQTALEFGDMPFPEPSRTWEFSFAFLGGTPGDALLDDDETLYNLTWTYRGTDTITGSDVQQSTIGYFSALSEYEDGTVDWYAAQAYERTPDPDPDPNAPPPLPTGLVFNSANALFVPSEPEGPAPVPEPGTIFLVGTGLLGALRMRQRRTT